MAHRHWPLFDLKVRTPRLELRYPDDETAAALADRAATGVHDPGTMPFAMPWTDVKPPELQRNTMQYFWRSRANWTADDWDLPMAVFVDGEPLGVQGMMAKRFNLRRSFETGSWLAQSVQGRGIGKEMRAAMLHLGFAGLGAEWAHTAAWHDNHASLGVTQALGYAPNGETVDVRRNETGETMLGFRMSRADWEARRRDDIVIENLEPCLPLFGV